MDPPSYEYLPHAADVRFRACGSTMEEAFEQAALAMFNVIVDTKSIRPEEGVEINVKSSGPDTLLFDYLSELLYLFEVEEIIFGEFKIDSIKSEKGIYYLSGQARGEHIDLFRHSFDTEVKAVTYHQLSVARTDSGYCAHVIVDT